MTNPDFKGVFHSGGVVPPPAPEDRLVKVHGGEYILTPAQFAKLQRKGRLRFPFRRP